MEELVKSLQTTKSKILTYILFTSSIAILYSNFIITIYPEDRSFITVVQTSSIIINVLLFASLYIIIDGEIKQFYQLVSSYPTRFKIVGVLFSTLSVLSISMSFLIFFEESPDVILLSSAALSSIGYFGLMISLLIFPFVLLSLPDDNELIVETIQNGNGLLSLETKSKNAKLSAEDIQNMTDEEIEKRI